MTAPTPAPTADWIEEDAEGYAPGTTVMHHAPTCEAREDSYVADPPCAGWTTSILSTTEETVQTDPLPPTGGAIPADVILGGTLAIVLGVALIRQNWRDRKVRARG